MSFSINQVVLVGNVTKDPELKYTANNNAVCNFNVATNRSIKKDDGFEDVATFHRVVIWGKMAEYVGKSLAKGDQVTITGRIDNRSFEQDGVTKYISEIVADSVIGPRKKSNRDSELAQAADEVFGQPKKQPARAPQSEFAPPTDGTDDDIPF